MNTQLHVNCFFQLLAPEIRHERNVILQCVRHIVNNDFFGRRMVNNNDRQKVGLQRDNSMGRTNPSVSQEFTKVSLTSDESCRK